MRRPTPAAWAALALILVPAARADDPPAKADASKQAAEASIADVPESLSPFAGLIGGWEGEGIPAADRLKGWHEVHRWAWSFTDGTPAALTFDWEGDKTLVKGRLAFDPEAGRYTLAGTDPGGNEVMFTGTLDDEKQTLILDRRGRLAGRVAQRLTIRLNDNGIRYTVWDDRKPNGVPRFAREIAVNLGKQGEAFAAGDAAQALPKCILTGGAASMSVTYKGRSYPVCCSGCRDEFEADPEKYVKKAAARAAATASTAPKSDLDRIGKDDGSFDALLGGAEPDEPEPEPEPVSKPKAEAKSKPKGR